MNELSLEEQLKQLQKEPELTPDAPDKNKIAEFLLKKIPFLLSLLASVDKASLSLDKLAAFYNATKGLAQAAKGLRITAAVLGGVEFLTIPMAFIACKIVGKEFPFELSTGAKWVYSAALFALAVTALAVPATAIPIAFASASLVLASSVLTLGNFFFSKRQLAKKLKEVDAQIDKNDDKLNNIQKIACGLENSEVNRDPIQALNDQKITLLKKRQKLINYKVELVQKQESLNIPALLDKTVGVGLAVAGLTGVALSIFFPPVGLGLLAATAAFALTYLGGRIGYAIFSNKNKQSNQKQADKPGPAEEKNDTDPVHEATLDIAKSLFGSPKHDLLALKKAIHKENEVAEKITSRVNQIIKSDDKAQANKMAIDFMADLGKRLQISKYTAMDLQVFFASIDNFEKIIPILRNALSQTAKGEINVNEEQLAALKQVPQIRLFMESQQDELNTMHVKAAPLQTQVNNMDDSPHL
jgi:hypothetical protein